MEAWKEKLGKLTTRLWSLTKDTYDVDLFKLRKNYILGTFIVDQHSPVNFKWYGPYSNELYPQHWLVHLLIILRASSPSKHKAICKKYDISESKLYNNKTVNSRISKTTKDLENIIDDVSDTLLTDEQSLEIGIKIRKKKSFLERERVKELTEIMEVISILKQGIEKRKNKKEKLQ